MDEEIFSQIGRTLSGRAEWHATFDFTQWQRLSQTIPHPMEEGYSRLINRKADVEMRHNVIRTNLAICLTSPDIYLRTYASLVNATRS